MKVKLLKDVHLDHMPSAHLFSVLKFDHLFLAGQSFSRLLSKIEPSE